MRGTLHGQLVALLQVALALVLSRFGVGAPNVFCFGVRILGFVVGP